MRARVRKGFNLIELLLSLGLLAALAAISLPIYQSLQNRNALDLAEAAVAQGSRRAQALSAASYGDAVWGIKLQAGSVVVFKGASYAARDSSYDEIYDMPSNIAASGLTEITYAKLSGAPSASGTVTLTGANNETRAIIINSEGTADF